MVNSQITTPITLNPNAVRYTLTADRLNGVWTGRLDLQRSQRTDPGTWIDDPRQDASVTVDLPAMTDALNALVTVLPDLLGRVMSSITLNAVTDVRLRLTSKLLPDTTLDVGIGLQVKISGTQWIAEQVQSLNTLLAANTDLIAPVMTAWAGVDAAVDAANQAEGWV